MRFSWSSWDGDSRYRDMLHGSVDLWRFYNMSSLPAGGVVGVLWLCSRNTSHPMVETTVPRLRVPMQDVVFRCTKLDSFASRVQIPLLKRSKSLWQLMRTLAALHASPFCSSNSGGSNASETFVQASFISFIVWYPPSGAT